MSVPPGPRLPRAVQTAGFLLAPVPFMDRMRRRYGDVVSFRTLMDPHFVMVFEPSLLKTVFQGPADQLRAGEANAILEPVVGTSSLLLLDSARHLRERKLMLPAFHGERLKAYERVVEEATDDAIDGWPVGPEFTLRPAMQSLTLDVIMGAVFGVAEGRRRDELKDGLRGMLDVVSSTSRMLVITLLAERFLGQQAMRRFEASRAAVDAMIFDEISERRLADDLEERDDVFSMLLLARDEDGQPMTDTEIRDELMTLLVAGHETTATGLAWAFDLLLHHPDALARARAEIEEGETAYLDAVIKETLRLRPVIPGIGRKVREAPFPLGGYEVPVGMEINPSIAVMHQRPDLYPEPDRFRPERFLGPGAPDTYTWIPFGGGVRRCIGASFALLEMRVAIRTILARTELRATGEPEKLVRQAITQVPKRGVRVRQARRPSARTSPAASAGTQTPPPAVPA
jgi:cytochrome P450